MKGYDDYGPTATSVGRTLCSPGVVTTKAGQTFLSAVESMSGRTFLSSQMDSSLLGWQECHHSQPRWQTGMSAPPTTSACRAQTGLTQDSPLQRCCHALAVKCQLHVWRKQ